MKLDSEKVTVQIVVRATMLEEDWVGLNHGNDGRGYNAGYLMEAFTDGRAHIVDARRTGERS